MGNYLLTKTVFYLSQDGHLAVKSAKVLQD